MTRTADLDDPSSPNGRDVLTPPSRAGWRSWLASNPDRQEGLWIVYRKKSSSLDGPVYDDLVEEALCFGWIDSQSRRVDGDRMMQWFSPRRKGGLWSALNKDRIGRLVREGLMTEIGQATIDEAKADGSWSQTDEVDALVVPSDLEAALDATPEAKAEWRQHHSRAHGSPTARSDNRAFTRGVWFPPMTQARPSIRRDSAPLRHVAESGGFLAETR